MRIAFQVLMVLMILGSILSIDLSFYPGLLPDLLFTIELLSGCWGPIAIVILVIVGQWLFRRYLQGRLDLPPAWQFDLTAVVMALTLVLLIYGIPRRVAFLASRPAFERFVASAPLSKYGGEVLDARVGLYRVDRYAADPRGGVYFRVYSGADFLDIMSHGFAYRPNRQGTPFGSARYEVFHIAGDWFIFRASNDW